eukprot:CAMPEP_0174841852 /NCGR_PEP_ID=MMETSP1114-20130205/9580_1 /TAXON_ID=312471 /ORGANISM="Neobodo designis, Strain CCAP 1951/1" /LENGTH=640 /DNA_ID=CAMNT_0016076049 /DNA_START=84 /DNA_END=2007 /DNA_ORIENTATION=+
MLAQAINAWTELDLATRRGEWDESYGHIVTNKENGVSERQNLVNHVKQFAAAFKQDPSTERVESLLRYMKRFINSLYERVEVAEDGFLSVYQKIALIDDPAPILTEAQQQLTAKVRLVSQLENELHEAQEALEGARSREQQLRSDLASIGTHARDEEADRREKDSEARQLVREYERQLATLEQELHAVRRDRDSYKRSVEALQERLDDASAAAAAATAAEDDDEFASPNMATSGTHLGANYNGNRRAGAASASDDFGFGRLADERVERLQRMLDAAERDLQREAEARSALEKRLADADKARVAAEAEWAAQLQNARSSAASAATTKAASAAPLLDDAGDDAPAKKSGGGGGASVAALARRITELERSLQRSNEELAGARRQLRDRNAADLDALAAEMIASADGVPLVADDDGDNRDTNDDNNEGGEAAESKAAAGGGGFLSEADFSSLIGDVPASSRQTTSKALSKSQTGTPSVAHAAAPTSSGGEGDRTVAALLKQRESLKKQLADAHAVVARLNAQLRTPRFPAASGAAGNGRCPHCSGASPSPADGGFALAIGNAASVAKSAGASVGAEKRRRDAALSALDRVGAMLGAMLQVSRAARVGVVLYLADFTLSSSSSCRRGRPRRTTTAMRRRPAQVSA